MPQRHRACEQAILVVVGASSTVRPTMTMRNFETFLSLSIGFLLGSTAAASLASPSAPSRFGSARVSEAALGERDVVVLARREDAPTTLRRRVLMEERRAEEDEGDVVGGDGGGGVGVDVDGSMESGVAPEEEAPRGEAAAASSSAAIGPGSSLAHGGAGSKAEGDASDSPPLPEVSGEMKKLDDALSSLHKKLEDDLHRVEEDAALAAKERKEQKREDDAVGADGDGAAAETTSPKKKKAKKGEDLFRAATLKHYKDAYPETNVADTGGVGAGKKKAVTFNVQRRKVEKKEEKAATAPVSGDAPLEGVTNDYNSTASALTNDITAVRRDIGQLLQAVTEAEAEIMKEREHIVEEQREIDQKTAEIEAEKIVAGMKEGTVKVHVDYETGEVVVDKDEIRSARKAARSAKMGGNSKQKEGEDDVEKGNENAYAAKDTLVGGGESAAVRLAASSSEYSVGTGTEGAAAVTSANKAANTDLDSKEMKKRPEEDASSVDVIIDAAKDAVQKRESASASADQTQRTDADGRPIQKDIVADAATVSEKKDGPKKEIDLDPALRSRVEEEIEALRTEEDPAVMNLDVQLLLDVVTVAIAAAVFGLLAAFLRLPPTAGFLLGGMCIGPSALDLVDELRQVQTLAQFGSIFLLFEQGLLYSRTYKQVSSSTTARSLSSSSGDDLSGGSFLAAADRSDDDAEGDQGGGDDADNSRRRSLPGRGDGRGSGGGGPQPLLRRSGSGSNIVQEDAAGRRTVVSVLAVRASSLDRPAENDGDNPNVVGAIVFIVLVFSLLTIFVFLDVASSVSEALIVSSSVALCSTTIVSENLHIARIEHTAFGNSVLQMISMQDLFMVALLALPETCRSFHEQLIGGSGDSGDDEAALLRNLVVHVLSIAVFVKLSLLLARHVVHATILAESRVVGSSAKGEGVGELFTLSIVAYVLMMSALAEELSLSIEAGAVFAGIVLIRSEHVPKILESIQPLSSVFGGMYLTSMGMIMSPSFIMDRAGAIIWLVCAIGCFKLVLISYSLHRLFHYGATASLAVGSAMAQISEISLLVMAKAQRLGLVSRQVYLMLIPTTCILLTLAPLSASHLRQLKVKEIAGNEDDNLPFRIHLIRYVSGFIYPQQALASMQRQNGNGMSRQTYDRHSHRT